MKFIYKKTAFVGFKSLVICFFFLSIYAKAATPFAFYNNCNLVYITAGEVVTIQGSLVSDNGSIQNNGILTLTENWTNLGATNVYSGATGETDFIGTTATQTINGPTRSDFWDLVINNTSGITPAIVLATNVPARNSLTMLSGLISLGTHTLKLGTATATPGTLNYTAGWMYGTTGGLLRYIDNNIFAIGDARGHFPVGSSVDYRPLWLAIKAGGYGGNGVIEVGHTGVYPSWYTPANHNDATWAGGTTVAGVSQSTWDITDAFTGIMTAAGLVFDLRYGGNGFATFNLTDLDASLASSCVNKFVAATSAVVPLEVNRTNVTLANLMNGAGGTQNWRIGTKDVVNSPLPIELLTFNAVPNDKKQVELSWSTATEINSDHFTVERTKDADIYEKVAEVAAAGNSSVVLNYAALDEHPYAGTSYYRLKQTDFDGSYTYSNLVAVDIDGSFQLSGGNVFSNQNAQIKIDMNSINEPVQIKFINAVGQSVYGQMLQAHDNSILIDMSCKLAAGVYLLTMQTIDGKQYSADKIIITN